MWSNIKVGDLVKIKWNAHSLRVPTDTPGGWGWDGSFCEEYARQLGIVITHLGIVKFPQGTGCDDPDDPQFGRWKPMNALGVELRMHDGMPVRIPIDQIDLISECP